MRTLLIIERSWIMTGLFVLGLGVGTIGTLLGVGGGFILIPIFLLAFHYTPQHAIGTSLSVVFFNALSGSVAYIRQKRVHYDAAVRFSIATLPGALMGSYAARYFTSRSFYIVFGLVLIIIAVILYRRGAQENSVLVCDASFQYKRTLGVLISMGVGFLSSILGIGGGIIHVPVMVCVLGFPTFTATATSHFVLAISSFVGVVSHFLLGNILLRPALIIGVGAVIGAQLGAVLSHQAKPKWISLLLAIALAAVGLRLILGATL
jgi:hypothetical protein